MNIQCYETLTHVTILAASSDTAANMRPLLKDIYMAYADLLDTPIHQEKFITQVNELLADYR